MKKYKGIIITMIVVLTLCFFWISLFKSPTSMKIAGDDKNRNGIWDDMEPFIKKYANTSKERSALVYLIKTSQKELLSPEHALYIRNHTGDAVLEDDYAARGMACARQVFGGKFGSFFREFEETLLSSSARIRAQSKVDDNYSGGVYPTWNSKTQGSPCQSE